MRRLVALIAATACAAGLLAACSSGGGGSYTVTAYFPRTISLYPSNDVRVLGLHAGHVKKVMVDGNCLLQNGADYIHAVYHPASRFWLFQGIETMLFAGTALALMLFSAWWTHQRTT